MTQAIARTRTFDEFITFDDGNELNEYELVAGRLILMSEPSDWHEENLEFLSFMVELQYRRQKLRYSVRKRSALMLDDISRRHPDIAENNTTATPKEYSKPGIRTKTRMIVEIASGNWSTDLVEKQEEYEALGVNEYWIVDYRGQIPAKYCQRGKGPKVIVLKLFDGIYQKAEYLAEEVVPCFTFPEMRLTVEQILAAEE